MIEKEERIDSYHICPYCGQIVKVGDWTHIFDSENYPPMKFRKTCRIENSHWSDEYKSERINKDRIRQILLEHKRGFLPVEPSWVEGNY